MIEKVGTDTVFLKGGTVLKIKDGSVYFYGSLGLMEDDLHFASIRYDDYEIRKLQEKIIELSSESVQVK